MKRAIVPPFLGDHYPRAVKEDASTGLEQELPQRPDGTATAPTGMSLRSRDPMLYATIAADSMPLRELDLARRFQEAHKDEHFEELLTARMRNMLQTMRA